MQRRLLRRERVNQHLSWREDPPFPLTSLADDPPSMPGVATNFDDALGRAVAGRARVNGAGRWLAF